MQEESIERFFYWIHERISIQEKKDRFEPWPWTDDPIFQEYKFTNAFRERDKTTAWFRECIRDPLSFQPEVYMATIIFRWFNLIDTGRTLIRHNLHLEWDPQKAYDVITPQKQWITGAYMIKSPTGMNKVRGVCQAITTLWDDRKKFLDKCPWETLEGMSTFLEGYPYLGPFLSYEITTDLRHTSLGNKASDINTWANAGPGAMRGLNRMKNRDLNYTSKKHDWCLEMRELLVLACGKYSLDFELREIEHSLCEYDKYERVRLKQGSPRSKYTAPSWA